MCSVGSLYVEYVYGRLVGGNGGTGDVVKLSRFVFNRLGQPRSSRSTPSLLLFICRLQLSKV